MVDEKKKPVLTVSKMTNFIWWLLQRPKLEGHCPTCDRLAKVYKRRFHANMARQMIALYKLGAAHEYVHTHKVMVLIDNYGDITKGLCWGLITKSPEKPTNGARTNGKYMLTQAGVDFVLGWKPVPKYLYLLFDEVVGKDDEMVYITDVLRDKGFNYHEMMQEEL